MALVISFLISLVPMNAFVHAASATVYKVDPSRFEILDGRTLPSDQRAADKFEARVTPGEYKPFSLLIKPGAVLSNVRLSWGDFGGNNGKSMPASILDPYVVKVWYQAGVFSDDTSNKHLVQELLLKDDKLVMVDYDNYKNFLHVTKPQSGLTYQDISTPNEGFPEDATIKDADSLQPFSMTDGRNKQLMLIAHIPDGTPQGVYSSMLTISSDQGTIGSFPIKLTVLPFKLDESRLTYGIYYHGYVDDFYPGRKFGYLNKTSAQYEVEMRDLKEHGILYPTTYQATANLDKDLNIRKNVGLPTDKIFTLYFETGKPQDSAGLSNLQAQVQAVMSKAAQHGYKEVYVYGIDEARAPELREERTAWNLVHQLGAKIYVAGYRDMIDAVGDIIDVAVIQKELDPALAAQYHAKGKKIFSYSNPQVGQENAEIYRRNFGLALWKAGYDGMMNYAYQKGYGTSMWNDFDSPGHYREETFTYPVTNGLVSTIQWEGQRQGVIDVRYISTLLNCIAKKKAQGYDMSGYERWVNSLDISGNLDDLRDQIATKIMELCGSSVNVTPQPSPSPTWPSPTPSPWTWPSPTPSPWTWPSPTPSPYTWPSPTPSPYNWPTPTPWTWPSPSPYNWPTPSPTPSPWTWPSPTPTQSSYPTPSPYIPSPTPSPYVQPTPTPLQYPSPSPYNWQTPTPTPAQYAGPTPSPHASPFASPRVTPTIQPPPGGGTQDTVAILQMMKSIMERLIAILNVLVKMSSTPSPSPASTLPAATRRPIPSAPVTRPTPPSPRDTQEPSITSGPGYDSWLLPWSGSADWYSGQPGGPSQDPTPKPSPHQGLFERNLGVGSQGPDVLLLQQFLNNRGFAVASTGPGSAGNETLSFGKGTKAALASFQASVGIVPASGFLGPATRSFLASQGW
jgi:hypothetical protein